MIGNLLAFLRACTCVRVFADDFIHCLYCVLMFRPLALWRSASDYVTNLGVNKRLSGCTLHPDDIALYDVQCIATSF